MNIKHNNPVQSCGISPDFNQLILRPGREFSQKKNSELLKISRTLDQLLTSSKEHVFHFFYRFRVYLEVVVRKETKANKAKE